MIKKSKDIFQNIKNILTPVCLVAKFSCIRNVQIQYKIENLLIGNIIYGLNFFFINILFIINQHGVIESSIRKPTSSHILLPTSTTFKIPSSTLLFIFYYLLGNYFFSQCLTSHQPFTVFYQLLFVFSFMGFLDTILADILPDLLTLVDFAKLVSTFPILL